MKQKINIAFDAKRAFENFTGLGNYSRTLLEALATYCPELSLHLFAPKKKENPRTDIFLAAPFQTHFPSTLFTKYWRSKGVVKDLLANNIQIYHGLSHEIPLGIEKTNIKTVVTIHDLIFKKYPRQFKPLDRWIYEKKFRSACERADRVVAISESTKNDIIHFYKIPEHKIKVIYQSIHQQFFQPINANAISQVRQQLNLPEEYLLYVGSAIPRKNLKLLVEAYASITQENFPALMIIGQGGKYRQEIEQFININQLQHKIRFLDQAKFSDFPALYAGATAMCYPSVYEGFGLPLVESLAQQTPVITYRGSSLPEAAGPGALYLETLSQEEVTNALQDLVNHPEKAAELGRAGQNYIRQFAVDKISQQWAKLYEELLMS